MRVRPASLLPLALLAAALSACGGGTTAAPPTTTATATTPPPARLLPAGIDPPRGCYVTVFMVEDATRAQVARMRRRLLASRLVRSVSFVPKALVFRRFAKTDPAAAKLLGFNPFGDRFEVVPRTRDAALALIADLATDPGPIANATPSRGCAPRG
jgi:hypothetical protein